MSSDTVVIHVRFAPNGKVMEIGERPQAMDVQAWFTLLSDAHGTKFQPFAGGRGIFRVSREEVDALKGTVAA